jgi:hypothetical protein
LKQDWAERLEKWLIRLTVIQFVALIIAQILMNHAVWTPYLNQAVRDEGVLKTKKTDTVNTMEESPAVWYDKLTKHDESKKKQ